ncbi:NOP2/Sun RNA methyltransferase 4 [Phyllostomus discolor]|uniref:NOP2/Sun RNA methyltransferase 4 n=1 Tax=Phyllostomus discolor TaxID=89673 RepID=A0A834EAY6_9CHIR|nr:NOP2/Sun RNA methyltransferase 4 [Phyllostomus discolor]
MISPLPEQADFRRSFTAMYLKILEIRVEFESPHWMAGSGENWRGTPMIGCWWMYPVPQTATPFMRRRTTFFSGRGRRSGRCYLCCRCSFLRLDSLPPNPEATLFILPAHSHTYRMSMWCKAPSNS